MDEVHFREAERRLWASFGATPTEQRIQLGSTGVAIRVQEVGEGPAVVFVHGACNGGASWAPLVARLDGLRCVMIDRPGCGLSDPLGARLDDTDGLGAFADALVVDVLDAMDLDRAHVVATSLGGYIALRTAAAHPDRIARMVQLGWPAGATRMPLPLRLASVPMFGRMATAVKPNDRAVRALLRRIGLREALDRGRISPAVFAWYAALLRDTDTLRNDLGAGPRFPLRRMDDRALLPANLLGRIHTPIRFLWGEEDPFGGADVARRFVPLLPDAELELMPGVGHAPWVDDPDHAATTTLEFLLP